MKPLFWIGLVLLALGLISLVVPIPQSERSGVDVGGMSMHVETHHDEKIPPVLSGLMILGGAALMYAGNRKA